MSADEGGLARICDDRNHPIGCHCWTQDGTSRVVPDDGRTRR